MQGGVSTCQATLKTKTAYRLHNALPTQARSFWEATGQNQEVAKATTDTVAQKSDQLQSLVLSFPSLLSQERVRKASNKERGHQTKDKQRAEVI